MPSVLPLPASSLHQVKFAVVALAVGGFALGTTEFSIMGLLPEVSAGLGVSITDAGVLISAYALGVVVGAPILAAATARMSRRKLVLGLMVLFTIANASSYFAPTFEWLILTRFISGLPHGAYFGVAVLIAASLVGPTKRAQAVAMVMLGLSVANVVGVAAVTWLGQNAGWRHMFTVVAVVGLLTIVLLYFFVPAQSVHAGASIRRELGALASLQVWLTLFIGIVGFGGFFAVYSYIAPTMTDVSGFPSSAIPIITSVYGLGMVAGNIIGGKLADHNVMRSIYVVLTLIVASLLAFHFLVELAWAAIIMIFVIGAVGSALVPGLQTRLMDVSPDAPSLAASLNHSALNVANALGAFLGGAVIAWGWGLKAPALVGAILALLGLGIAALSGVIERRRQDRTSDAVTSVGSSH
ncbi:MFS transporter [Arthrobacter roseus]|uniref:MFS transporter n=1 Tax=Arthrobacter roseus TaxID=136274 RepID=UPI0019666BDE|nr:MFS transporter [Arthrobacter roseus]